ncbi:MAG: PKD domain-containing protein [Flavihumibacter sp.]
MKPAITILLFLLPFTCLAQPRSNYPYHINGNAFQENCNCYTLTPDQYWQSGSVWNVNKIDLRESFDYQFEVYLGCTDSLGADGIAFVLQPISTSVGTDGNGLGYQGIAPSVAVLIDTWQNTEDGDPYYDHISIASNGVIQHNSPNDLTGAVPALPNQANIEDCKWHNLHIQWNAGTHTLTASIDAQQQVKASVNLVDDVFGGESEVFWGFSASTGGSRNLQRFCTSLNATFSQQAAGNYCAPAVISFEDHSRSFGSITEWYWNFGDGTEFNGPNPPPHAYNTPGNYEVAAAILGNNGCWSDTFKQVITVGSVPTAVIDMPGEACDNKSLLLQDRSVVEYGAISQWNWVVNGQSFSVQHPAAEQLHPGTLSAWLQVRTEQGCVSEPVEKTAQILPAPAIGLQAADSVCAGATVSLLASSTRDETPVTAWHWEPPAAVSGDNAAYPFSSAAAGRYTVSVYGVAANGCYTDTLQHTLTVVKTIAYAGRDTVLALNEPLVLEGSGGPILNCWPTTGLSDAAIANPTALPGHDMTYYLTASTPLGCESTDSIRIRVYKGPEIYVPNAFSPNGDQLNDQLRFIAPGIRQVHYFRIYNRWGQLLYNSTSPEGWDGRYQNREQAPGMYIWMISGEDLYGRMFNKKGTLLLVR